MMLMLGDVVKMRKKHPCGSDLWTITRVGADIKMRCQGCARVVMMDRPDFEKRVKSVVERVRETVEDNTDEEQ